MAVKGKTGPGWVRFWLKSNRGTDVVGWRYLSRPMSKSEVKDLLEEWCSGYGAWNHSDNMVSYGWERKQLPLKVLMQKLEEAKRIQLAGNLRVERLSAELEKRKAQAERRKQRRAHK